MKIAKIANIAIPTPIPWLASSFLFDPIAWATKTVIPMDKPVITIATILKNWLPVATPDCSKVPANFPTIIKSAAPYIACKKSANKTGKAKEINDFKIFPFNNVDSFIF